MGWLYYADTRARLIRDRVAGFEDETTKLETLKWTCTGNNLWMVRRSTRKETGEAVRWIELDLLAPSKHGWGYKDLDESMGPYQVNCPLSYLDGLSEPSCDFSREWRERVRAHHAELDRRRRYAKSLRIGDRVTVYGAEYVVRGTKPRGALEVSREGRLYTAKATQLTVPEEWR